MIRMLMEDTPEDHCWEVACDNCGFCQTFTTSEEIKHWRYKTIFMGQEKHYCPSCKSN